jgi:hypothetical protein
MSFEAWSWCVWAASTRLHADAHGADSIEIWVLHAPHFTLSCGTAQKVGVFTRRRLLYDCSARACGPDEPGGDPRGPGGEAQWPGGGYTAWTERATGRTPRVG